jgi:hypothetical protein
MANKKISQLTEFTGSTAGVYTIMNTSDQTATYKVTKETLTSNLATTGSNIFIGQQTITGSLNITSVINLSQVDPLPSGNIGDLAVSGSTLYFFNGTQWGALSTSPSPSPSVTPSVSVTPSTTPSAGEPSISVTPSVSVTPSTTPSAGGVSVTPTATPSATPSVSTTPSAGTEPSVTPSVSTTPSAGGVSVTPTATPSSTPSVSTTPSAGTEPSVTPSISTTPSAGGVSVTPTATPSSTPSAGSPSVTPTTTPSVSITPSPTSTPTPYTIGQAALGGTIAYILQSGDPGYDAGVQHGLVATATDTAANAVWGCPTTAITGADGIVIGTGNQNTIDIMAGCATAGIAARLCGDLSEGGYSDWYLPSKNELNKLYLNKDAIGGFTSSTSVYWSSTESDTFGAWVQNFNDGTSNFASKSSNPSVRAIRSF